MHHFTKRIKKKLWYHLALPFGSALITVALLDMISSLSWFLTYFKMETPLPAVKDSQNLSFTVGIIDIFQWIYVTYKVMLSLVLCIGGIFMGRRLIVIIWLLVSIMVDLVHLSECIFIISKPNLVSTCSLFLTIAATIWSDLKIIRIKYRIIRRSLTTTSFLKLSSMLNGHGDFLREKCDDQDLEETQEISFMSFKVNLVSLIKLIRNLYNLMTWHLASFYSKGEDISKILKYNHSAMILEQGFIRYAHIFLDSLTVVYIIQEKKLLLTPWIAGYILSASTTVAITIFVMQQLGLLTSVFSTVYYIVFSIDLFLRSGFVIYCLQLIIKTRHII